MTRKKKPEVTPAKETVAASAPMAEAAAPKTRKARASKPKQATEAVISQSTPSATVEVVAPAPDAMSVINLHDEIAKEAYSYWEGRGRLNGSPVEDWLRAEREVRRRFAAHA